MVRKRIGPSLRMLNAIFAYNNLAAIILQAQPATAVATEDMMLIVI